jgi:hypothetical protein
MTMYMRHQACAVGIPTNESFFTFLGNVLLEAERQVSVMQEDVLGTRRTAISETYVNCARCGKATRLRYARIVQSDVLSDSHSDFEYLCPECQKALAEGEKDLPLA